MGHRYIGSKSKILPEVLQAIQSLAPSGAHVVDLMCGTASVSSALREAGFRVTAVDVMTYSFHHARVALLLDREPGFEQARTYIQQHLPPYTTTDSGYGAIVQILNNLPGVQGYFWNEFSNEGQPAGATKPRNYFSPGNAAKIDAIRREIQSLHATHAINDIEHSLLIHDLIMAANDVANISGTYGHYLATLRGRALAPIQLAKTVIDTTNTNIDHTVIQGYAEDVAGTLSCDLCYIDPPYMKRQYAANYHILETLARGDSPEATGESGLRPWRDQYSNFCTKTKVRDSFARIFTAMQCDTFLLSYSEDGLLSIADLTDFLATFGSVTVHTIDHKRFRSNNSKLASRLTEYLIELRITR